MTWVCRSIPYVLAVPSWMASLVLASVRFVARRTGREGQTYRPFFSRSMASTASSYSMPVFSITSSRYLELMVFFFRRCLGMVVNPIQVANV